MLKQEFSTLFHNRQRQVDFVCESTAFICALEFEKTKQLPQKCHVQIVRMICGANECNICVALFKLQTNAR